MLVTQKQKIDIPCLKCGRMERKHAARGLCRSCYVMQYQTKEYREKKAQLTQKIDS